MVILRLSLFVCPSCLPRLWCPPPLLFSLLGLLSFFLEGWTQMPPLPGTSPHRPSGSNLFVLWAPTASRSGSGFARVTRPGCLHGCFSTKLCAPGTGDRDRDGVPTQHLVQRYRAGHGVGAQETVCWVELIWKYHSGQCLLLQARMMNDLWGWFFAFFTL